MGNGIVVVNAGTTDVDITNNKFNTGVTLIALPATITNAAIVVFNPTAQTVDATVSGNDIKRFRYGVWFTNVEGSNQFIFDNTMNFQQLTTNATGGAIHYGVRLQGCDNTVVDENKISKPGINPTLAVADEIRGVSVENSTDCQISENTLTKMGTGVWAEDNLFGSEIVCNIMKKNFIGIEFENTSIGNHIPGGIAQQNQWQNMVSTGFDIRGEVVSGAIEFWWMGSTGSNFDPLPTNVDPFTFSLGPPAHPANTTGSNYCDLLFSPGPVDQRESNIGDIVRNDLNFVSNESQNLWLTCNYAYGELEKDSSWLNLGTPDDIDYQNFYSMIDGGNIGALRTANEMAESGDITGAMTLNNAIADTCVMEHNHKMVNDVYLRNWAVSQWEYNVSDSAQLWTIAYGDPGTEGLSVYGARVMLFTDVELPGELHSMLIDNESSDYDNFEVDVDVELYPNPTNGELSLVFGDTKDGGRNVIVYSLTGQEIYKAAIGNNRIETINLSELENGLYLIAIFSNNEILTTQRLVIAK